MMLWSTRLLAKIPCKIELRKTCLQTTSFNLPTIWYAHVWGIRQRNMDSGGTAARTQAEKGWKSEAKLRKDFAWSYFYSKTEEKLRKGENRCNKWGLMDRLQLVCNKSLRALWFRVVRSKCKFYWQIGCGRMLPSLPLPPPIFPQ